ncbi:hypothetical protein TrLO_g15125 [Triparma laevis f. longispina]|uniref:Uncharacterized protein n=1 Tax=Triparma laevis f. longispina TaxID=1714387 RepID=A0A9W7CAN3_9STRA|nr:hypothetical protein TrLO_g15125 [Triparma laevis f. longispina]
MRFASAVFLLLSYSPFIRGSSECKDPGEVPIQGLIPVSNGCSKPPGMTVEGEEDFTYCCDRHDSCYQTCGMEKKFCEDDFGKCMNAMCKTTFTSNSRCKGAAQMYKLGVSMFGGAPFQNMQDQACECVPGDKVVDEYEIWFRKIYRSSDKSEEEQEEAVQKLKDKMDLLDGDELQSYARDTFYKLLKKYDNAIRHEGWREGRNKIPKPVKQKKKKKDEKKLEL